MSIHYGGKVVYKEGFTLHLYSFLSKNQHLIWMLSVVNNEPNIYRGNENMQNTFKLE